jgi:hypothetical protein
VQNDFLFEMGADIGAGGLFGGVERKLGPFF